MNRPAATDYHEYYQHYISLVPGDHFLSELVNSRDYTLSIYADVSEENGNYRYAEGKWSFKEMLQHLMDTERIFAYRALCIARNDKTNLPGFDHDAYVASVNCDQRSVADMLDEYLLLRASTIKMFENFTEEELNRKGMANNAAITPLALGFIIPGHELHHISVLKERYMVK